MKKKLKSLLSLVLSLVMMASVIPSTAMAAEKTSVVKDRMDWKSWCPSTSTSVLEGMVYNVGAFGSNNIWKGYVNRGKDYNAKHWISDSAVESYSGYNVPITDQIYTVVDGAKTLVDLPNNGGKAWGYAGMSYIGFGVSLLGKTLSDMTSVPKDKWLGVKDISAYKDNGYVVFTLEKLPINYNNGYFAITTLTDVSSIGLDPATTTLPLKYEDHVDTAWAIPKVQAVTGVKMTDYIDTSITGKQEVMIPLSEFVDTPDLLEFGGSDYDSICAAYAVENYTPNLQLYTGLGIVKQETGGSETIEVRYYEPVIVSLDDPENLSAKVDGDRITLSWESEDSDVNFIITRTLDGVTETIDAGSSTTYTDSVSKAGTYTYTVTAEAETYGLVSKTSNEVTAFVESATEKVNVIKDDIDWEKWLDTYYSSHLLGRSFYVSSKDEDTQKNGGKEQGPNNAYNDFHWWSDVDGELEIVMNDPDYTYNHEGDIAKYAVVSGTFADIPTSDGVLWGYKGTKYYNTDVSSIADTIPENRWLGVNDISEYEENGYFIFDVKVENASFDMENAYLAIEVVTDKKGIGLSSSDTLPATKDKYPTKLNWKKSNQSFVLGVKLSDYYDTEARGQQRLYIPIKEFTQNYDLKEVFSKSSSTSEEDFASILGATPVDLRLFAGMGIAKKDSQSEDPKAFKIKVYDLQIGAVQTPTGVTAKLDEDGKVNVTWNATTDVDVVYNLYRKAGSKEELLYTGSELEYVDTLDTNGVYSYYVVASHKDQTKLVSKASDSSRVTFISGEATKSEIMKFSFWWNEYNNGDYANFYIGEKNQWGDYGHNGTAGTELMGSHIVLQVNDYGFGDGQAEIKGSDYTGKKWNKQNWGYAGETFNMMALAETPEEFWCNVYDATDIADYGYAVLEIEPIVSEGIDTAYLAVTAPMYSYAMAAYYYNGLNTTNFTPETHPKDLYGKEGGVGKDVYATLVAGVKLTDYYDVAKGGKQTVAIPLKEFVDSPDFLDSYAKGWTIDNGVEVKESTKIDLSLINGLGIVREDNDATEALGFKAKVYTMGIFAPQIPTGLMAEVADNGDVTLSWAPTSDSDTSYRLARTNQGETTYINVGKEMSYTDTGLNPGNYTYSIAAIDDTCGIASAESEAITVKSIGAETDPTKYAFSFIYKGVNDEHSDRSYYVGDTAGFNNWGWDRTGAVDLRSTSMTVTLNDTGYVEGSTKGEIRTGDVTGKDWNDTTWGWGGLSLDVMADYPAETYKTDVPDKFWGDVLDISEYQNKGYAVFKINVTEDEGINDAYFTLTAAHGHWAIEGTNGGSAKITKENYPNLTQKQHYCTIISGVKVTDYYDKYEGGEQVIAIPLSEFVENHDFLDTYGKNWGKKQAEVTEYTTFDLSLFSGMGIARRISEDAGIKPLGFTASISAMNIVNLFTPSELKAVKGEESVSLSWFETSDIGVTYRLIKSSKDGVENIDVGTKTSYVDTNVKQGRTYSYQIVAVDSVGATSVPSAAVTAEFPYVTGINVYTGTGDNKQEATNTIDGDMIVEFYCPGQVANGYVAVYDENKLMTEYVPVELTGAEEWIPVEVTTTSANTLKAFLWDDEMNPLVDEVVIEPEESEVALLSAAPQIKNVIYMIPDGGGFPLFDFANGVKNEGGYSVSGYGHNTPVEKGDMYMKDYLIGTIQTHSANADVTDSAASGTALATGWKTNNGVVGLKPDGTPVASLTEAFQLMGKKTGIVTSVEWPHATPASFSAHAPDRYDYDDMAAQIINQKLDVNLPLGFIDSVQYGTSTNKEFTSRGYKVVNTIADIEAVKQGDRLWGGRPWYSSDMLAPDDQPNLAEMTAAAIRAMDGTDEGFFLMVEGSSVDGGGHQNDNILSTSEFLAFDEAFKVAVEYAKGRNDTIVIACPDHDTGGLKLPGCTDTLTGGQPDYSEYLDAILTVCGGSKDTTLQWTGTNHTALNGGLWAYIPEGILPPEGMATEAGDTEENRAREIEHNLIAPWIADVTGADLDKATEELFVDVTDMGTYDKNTQIFTFNDYDVQVKKNEAYAIINGEYVDLDGQVCIRPVSKFYVPQLLFESIRPVIREVDEACFFDAASGKALVKGQVDKTFAGQDVTLMVENRTDSEDVAYIDQFDVLDDGSYVCWFSLDRDIDDYDVKVKIGASDIDTDAIAEASSLYQWIDSAYTVEVEDGVIETEVAIQNYAGLAGLTYDMLMMFYDNNGRLISCVKGDTTAIADGINYGFHDVDIIEGAAYAKFAVWSGALGAFPITTAETINLQ